jgi:uncharacterized protein YkvS
MYTGTVHNTQVKQARPTFERRHYKKIAEVINIVVFDNMLRGDTSKKGTMEYLAKLMAEMFEMDNPNFDQKKWEEAVVVYDNA